jgi:hypothetical protein
MPLNEQAQYTWQHGTYLTTRQWKGHTINLYHVDKFLVEVWYNPGTNCVDEVRSFKNKKCLELYLEGINLDL